MHTSIIIILLLYYYYYLLVECDPGRGTGSKDKHDDTEEDQKSEIQSNAYSELRADAIKRGGKCFEIRVGSI